MWSDDTTRLDDVEVQISRLMLTAVSKTSAEVRRLHSSVAEEIELEGA